jgi:hypothetical protein
MLVAAGSAALSSQAVAEVEKYPRNLTQQDVDRWMTELSNWGKWGKDDQAGTINLITPAKRKAAAALVREGVSVSMSLDADLPKQGSTAGPLPGMMGGVANRATWTLTSRPPGPDPRDLAAYVVDTIAVSYHGNNTTHLDAPSHLYYKGRIYNGYPQSGYSDRGAGKDDVMSIWETTSRFTWKTWKPGRNRPASAWKRATPCWSAPDGGCGCARKARSILTGRLRDCTLPA